MELLQETSLELVKENEFEKLSKLLGVAPWKPLRPLVLLLSWDQCSHPDMARSLLTVLHDDVNYSSSYCAVSHDHNILKENCN